LRLPRVQHSLEATCPPEKLVDYAVTTVRGMKGDSGIAKLLMPAREVLIAQAHGTVTRS